MDTFTSRAKPLKPMGSDSIEKTQRLQKINRV